ncbi:MAG: cell division protein FtsB, partial [Proteobacteria bacterium]|nr:cell division protein FtsB [Pseudomonadota bacterium]
MKILIALLAVLFVLMQYKLWFGEGSVREGLELSRTTEAQQLENDQARQRNEVLAAE